MEKHDLWSLESFNGTHFKRSLDPVYQSPVVTLWLMQ